jgi:hypothetical protein
MLLGATAVSIAFQPSFSQSPLEIFWDEIKSLRTVNICMVTISSGEQIAGILNYDAGWWSMRPSGYGSC